MGGPPASDAGGHLGELIARTETSLSLLRGEFDRALALTEQLFTAAWRVRRFTAEFSYAAMRSVVLFEMGRVAEAQRAFEPLNHPGVRAGRLRPCPGPRGLGDAAAARTYAASAQELADRAGAVLWVPRIAELQARLGPG